MGISAAFGPFSGGQSRTAVEQHTKASGECMNSILPAEAEPSNFLTDYSPREKWDNHRGNAQTIGSHYDRDQRFQRLGERIAGCSTSLGFAWKTDAETGESKLKLRTAKFCFARHCPVCQWRRSLRNTARFFSVIPSIQEKFPTHRWLFLTLTVRNCDSADIRETIKKMSAGWKRFIQRKDWPATGWMRSTEITRNPDDGTAHPHFHVLMMVPAGYFSRGYVPQAEWVSRWKNSLRIDYDPVVDVRAVKPKKDGQTIQAAVVETLKYATKAEDALNAPEWLYAITEQLHKLRFVASGGELKGLLREDFSNAELISGDDQTAEQNLSPSMWFGWQPTKRRYVKTK
jgi:plasmid rolling circle replication initiator protein Rep